MSAIGPDRGFGRRCVFLAGLLPWLCLMPLAQATTAEEATRVGGDLRKMGGVLACSSAAQD